MFTTIQKGENALRLFFEKKYYKASTQPFLRGQHCCDPMQTGATLLRYASPVTEQQKCWDLLGQKFDRFQTVRNKCQHCCGSMQTDAINHNIVGPNSVGCCWPTMLRPFAWALTHKIFRIHIKCRINLSHTTIYIESIDIYA